MCGGEEKCGFRLGRGMDQVLVVGQVCEKLLSDGKEIFWAFMDLEKANGTIDRHGMWRLLGMFGVRGKLLKVVRVSISIVGHVSGWGWM